MFAERMRRARLMISWRLCRTWLVARGMALLAGFALAMPLSLIVSVGSGNSAEGARVASVIWLASLYVFWLGFAWSAEGPRRALRRGLITLAVGAGALPLVALLAALMDGVPMIMRQAGGDDQVVATIRTVIVAGMAVTAATALAIPLGLPCLLLSRRLR